MNHSVWAKGRPITLPEILDAREKRAYLQQEMLQKRPRSLLSFTLNIAGPVKVFPYTKWLYTLGYDLIHQGIFILRGKILEEKEQKVGGFVIAGAGQDATKEATVIAIGQGIRTLNGELVAPSVKPGDKVLVESHAGIEVKDQDETFLVVGEASILAIVE